MKKLLAIMLAALMVLTLAACGEKENGNDNDANGAAEKTTVDQTDAATANQTDAAAADQTDAPAEETTAAANPLFTDGSKLGALQIVQEQKSFQINGLIIATGSGHHDYPELSTLLAEGYKTKGLYNEFYLGEWIELYGDIEDDKSTQIIVVPNDPGADYTKMTTSNLNYVYNQMDQATFNDSASPDPDENGKLCSFYVHQELSAGLYNVFFCKGETICYMVQLSIIAEPAAE